MNSEKPKGKPKTDQPYHTRGLLLITNVAAFMLVVLSADKWLGAVVLRGRFYIRVGSLVFFVSVWAFVFVLVRIYGLSRRRGIILGIVFLVLAPLWAIIGWIVLSLTSKLPHVTSLMLFIVTIFVLLIALFYPHTISSFFVRTSALWMLPFTALFAAGVVIENLSVGYQSSGQIHGNVYVVSQSSIAPIYPSFFEGFRCNKYGIHCESIWRADVNVQPHATMELIDSSGDAVLQITGESIWDGDPFNETFILPTDGGK